MNYYKTVYAYNKGGVEVVDEMTIGGLNLAYTLAHVRFMCSTFDHAECQIRAVYTGADDDWTEVPDWAEQERAQLDAITQQAEKEEKYE